jgi:hypothetical protein
LKDNLVLSSRIKHSNTLAKAKEYSAQIEENLISSKIEPFQFPHTKVEEKTKTTTNTAPDPITLLVHKFDSNEYSVCPKSESDYEQVDNFGEKPVYSKTSSFQTTKQGLEGEASTRGKGSQHFESSWNGQYIRIFMVFSLQ